MAKEISADIVVVGCGIAGLSAAVTAAEAGAQVVVIERASFEERGGNTRYTEAFFRMKTEDQVSDDFETNFMRFVGGYIDPSLIKDASGPRENWPSILGALSFASPDVVGTFAENAPRAIAWLKSKGVRFDFQATPFIVTSTTRMATIGGGLALIEALSKAAEPLDIRFFYDTTVRGLSQSDAGAVDGVHAIDKHGERILFRGKSIILGSGGFEGNPEMMARYLGPQALYLRPIARGGYYNKGECIEAALGLGAAPCGDFSGFHAEPIDPRSGIVEPRISIFPYGILVNKKGKRFTDEAPGPTDATYESVTLQIFRQPEGIAYSVHDARIRKLPNKNLAVRSDHPPVTAASLEELAGKLGMPASTLIETVADFNRACVDSVEFSPLAIDGNGTHGLDPAKSNWAWRIETPPFEAYPIICSNVFTYGGLKVNEQAQVLDTDGRVIKGLYAAGEVVGLYFGSYTGATSVMKGAVFGRIAGEHAAAKA